MANSRSRTTKMNVRNLRIVPEIKQERLLLRAAHSMSGDRGRFLEASGADGYLDKPVYDATVLVEKTRQLRRRRNLLGFPKELTFRQASLAILRAAVPASVV